MDLRVEDFDWDNADNQAHEWNCVGGHDEHEDCRLLDEHLFNCVGLHYGIVQECIPCGYPRCIGHGLGPAYHAELCENVYCTGHTPDQSGYADCVYGHAFFCRNANPAVDRQCEGVDSESGGCTWPSGGEGSPNGLEVFTDIAEETTVVTVDGTLETIEEIDDYLSDLATARKIMQEEALAVADAKQSIAVLIASIS